MGWASGSYLAEEVWSKVREHIPEAERKRIAKEVYDLFADRDADDWDASGLCLDAGVFVKCPSCECYAWKEDMEGGICEECADEAEYSLGQSKEDV